MTPELSAALSRVNKFVADGRWLHAPNGDGLGCCDAFAHGDRDALATRLATTLNAAVALLEKIDDNPTLFFGMEDTCQDEFDDLRDALDALCQGEGRP